MMNYLNKNFNALIVILFAIAVFIFVIWICAKWISIHNRNKHLKGFNVIEKNDDINDNEVEIIDKKTVKKIDKDLKETLKVWFELDFKFIKIVRVKDSADKQLAWYCFIEMMTRVVSNTFDEKGKCKDILNSTYILFQNIKKYTLENVNANNSAKISLVYMNTILRPFLVEWDSKINNLILEKGEEKEKPSLKTINEIEKKFRNKFEKSYNELIKKTKKKCILEKYCHFVGIKIRENKYTDKK